MSDMNHGDLTDDYKLQKLYSRSELDSIVAKAVLAIAEKIALIHGENDDLELGVRKAESVVRAAVERLSKSGGRDE